MSNNSEEMQVALQLLHAYGSAFTPGHANANKNSPKSNLSIGNEKFYSKHTQPITLKYQNLHVYQLKSNY